MFAGLCVLMDFDRPSVLEGCKDLIDFASAYTSIHCNCKGFHNGAQADNDPLNILHNRFPYEENKWCTAQGGRCKVMKSMVTWHESVTILCLDVAEFLALPPAQCWCFSTSSGKDARYFPHMNSLHEERSQQHRPARWAVLPSLSHRGGCIWLTGSWPQQSHCFHPWLTVQMGLSLASTCCPLHPLWCTSTHSHTLRNHSGWFTKRSDLESKMVASGTSHRFILHFHLQVNTPFSTPQTK